MCKLLNAILCTIVVATTIASGLSYSWLVPADPAEGGAAWGTTTNWDLGALPTSSDNAVILNPTGKYYCVFDPTNDPGIGDATITNLYVGNNRVGNEVVDGELVLESGKLIAVRTYIGGTDYINKVGRVVINNSAFFACSKTIYVGPTGSSENKDCSGGILILNDNTTATDKFNYSYFTRVGGNPGQYASNQCLLQLNDSSVYNANRLDVGTTGTVDVSDFAELRTKGAGNLGSELLALNGYIDAGSLIADSGASKVVITNEGSYLSVTASPRPSGADKTAWGFAPADGDAFVTSGTSTLRWVRGYDVSNDPNTSGVDTFSLVQNVYLSTNEALVTSRDGSVLVDTLSEEQALEVTGLTIGQTYYWVIDSEYADSSVASGTVNSFVTVNAVEDFESYADTAALQAVWGSDVTLVEGYQSANAMSVSYNDADVSVVASGSWDLLQGTNEQALTLKFMGAVANDEVSLSISLKDGSANTATVNYDGDEPFAMPSVNSVGWVDWNIDLADFTSVTLTDITEITISIITDIANTDGSAIDGTLVFDDIISAPAFKLGKAYLGDVTGDGVVNVDDLSELTTEWNWLFDGNVTDDSAIAMLRDSGTGASTETTANYETGQFGQAIRLNAATPAGQWVDIDDFLVGSFRNSTLSFWAKVYTTPNDGLTRAIIQASSSYRLYITLKNGEYNIQCGSPIGTTTATSSWKHIVVTTQDNENGLAMSNCYINGQAFTAVESVRHYGSYLNGINIGTYNNGSHSDGTDMAIDDVRFYDSVLTQADIANLYGGNAISQVPTVHYAFDGNLDNSGSITTVTAPYLNRDSDINLDGMINYGDFAVIADMWLDDVIFPYQD